jgi:DNA-binding transcriptional LysR family regulator
MFDPVLLRTFLAVADTHNFTQAAAQLGLSQPTVSQHVQRLEQAAGRQLVLRDTRGVRLSDNGDAMAGFARTILAAHDHAAGYFTGSAIKGRLRFGASDDLSLTQLPRILRDFRQSYPQINLELTVAQSGGLARRLEARQLDLVFVKQEAGTERGRLVRRDRLVWAAHRDHVVEPGVPVPLVVYASPSISRAAALAALERGGRTWRITCTSREVHGVHAAVRAGLGVTVLPQSLVPQDLVHVPAASGLPELPEIDFVLLDNPTGARGPADALSAAILDRPATTTGVGYEPARSAGR